MINPVDDIAHVIQTAITPVFLLSGIAALLNVFSTRLGRVADQVDRTSGDLSSADRKSAVRLNLQLAYLGRRLKLLDIAVVLGPVGGAMTCFAALLGFIGGIRDSSLRLGLLGSFDCALTATMGPIAAFLAVMLLASRGLQVKVGETQADGQS